MLPKIGTTLKYYFTNTALVYGVCLLTNTGKMHTELPDTTTWHEMTISMLKPLANAVPSGT